MNSPLSGIQLFSPPGISEEDELLGRALLALILYRSIGLVLIQNWPPPLIRSMESGSNDNPVPRVGFGVYIFFIRIVSRRPLYGPGPVSPRDHLMGGLEDKPY